MCGTQRSSPPSTRRPQEVARRGVAHVPEHRALFYDLTVRENLRLGTAHGRVALDRVLDYFPALAPMLDRKAGLLSGGEQQMLAIGRGIATIRKNYENTAKKGRITADDVAKLNTMPRELTPQYDRLRRIGLLERGFEKRRNARRLAPRLRLIVRPARIGPRSPRISLPNPFDEVQPAERRNQLSAAGGVLLVFQSIAHAGYYSRLRNAHERL